jgi:biopolymer transport protein ExbB
MNLTNLYAYIGAAGVALVFVAAAAVYLCIKYIVYLLWIGRSFRRYLAALENDPARLTGPAPANPLIRIFAEAVRHANRGADNLRAELAFLFHKHFRKVNRAMTLLRLISVISPLLGLLGTVLGISKVFRIIGAQTAVNPALLATGIWEALITTIMGLTITIPVLCFYYFFRMRINGFQIEVMEYAGHYGKPGAAEGHT